jgi:hypothetical protein
MVLPLACFYGSMKKDEQQDWRSIDDRFMHKPHGILRFQEVGKTMTLA